MVYDKNQGNYRLVSDHYNLNNTFLHTLMFLVFCMLLKIFQTPLSSKKKSIQEPGTKMYEPLLIL